MGISEELWDLRENYLCDRFQRVVLNGQTSSWKPVPAGVPKGSILGALLLLICISDLPNKVKTNANFFADDKSPSTTAKDINESADSFNCDLSFISKLGFQLEKAL